MEHCFFQRLGEMKVLKIFHMLSTPSHNFLFQEYVLFIGALDQPFCARFRQLGLCLSPSNGQRSCCIKSESACQRFWTIGIIWISQRSSIPFSPLNAQQIKGPLLAIFTQWIAISVWILLQLVISFWEIFGGLLPSLSFYPLYSSNTGFSLIFGLPFHKP